MKTHGERIDVTWDRSDFTTDAAWREMDAFVKECVSAGPPQTAEEESKRDARFSEIQRRIIDRTVRIAALAIKNEPLLPLNVVKH